MSKSKRIYFSVLTSALLVNGFLALVFGIYFIKCYAHPKERIDLRISGDFPYEQDDEIGYVPTRNGETTRTNTSMGTENHLFTDSRGARVNAPGEQVPAPVDVLFVGGSFLWGIGVENEQTVPEHLKQQTGLSVANLSLSGYGTLQAYQMLRRNLDLKPRVVVYAIIDDHIRRNLSPCAPNVVPYCLPVSHIDFTENGTPYIAKPPADTFSFDFNRRYFQDILMADSIGIDEVFLRIELDVSNILRRMHIDLLRIIKNDEVIYRNDPEARHRSLGFLIREMSQLTDEAGAKLIVMHVPYVESRYLINPPPPELKRAVEGTSAVLLDLSPKVMNHYLKNRDVPLHLNGDRHPNATANGLMADGLAEFLEKTGTGRGRLPHSL